MATKTISIEIDAYELLAREKKDRTESFSRGAGPRIARGPPNGAGGNQYRYAWRTALLQTSLRHRLGENDAWIAGTALADGATLVGRERAFARVPRLEYLTF